MANRISWSRRFRKSGMEEAVKISEARARVYTSSMLHEGRSPGIRKAEPHDDPRPPDRAPRGAGRRRSRAAGPGGADGGMTPGIDRPKGFHIFCMNSSACCGVNGDGLSDIF